MKDVKSNTPIEQEAEEKSFNKSPQAVNQTTLIMTIFLALVFIIGIFLIGYFLFSGGNGTSYGTNSNTGRTDP